uniref:Uncharacterized protein n=1 Tax=Romanomermis culicivorax TaxID=13658 RepID=A0A915L0D2_ROMCU
MARMSRWPNRASGYIDTPNITLATVSRKNSASNCGQCTMQEALKSYCSSSSNFKGTLVRRNRNFMRFSVENGEQKSKETDIFMSKSCSLPPTTKQKTSFFVTTNEYLGRIYFSCFIEWEKFRKMLEKTKNGGGESYCTNLELLQ